MFLETLAGKHKSSCRKVIAEYSKDLIIKDEKGICYCFKIYDLYKWVFTTDIPIKVNQINDKNQKGFNPFTDIPIPYNILKDLDPHSSFIPAKKRQSVNESLVGHFGGIGIRFMIYNDTLTIVDVIEGGPSKLAGLKKRDRIIKIQGENFAGVGIKNEDVLKKLKGKVGSEVNIAVLNPNNEIVKHRLIRGSIPLKSISASTIIKNKIGYIKLSSFSNSSDLEFKNAINELLVDGTEYT